MSVLLTFLHSQLLVTPPLPKSDYTGKTIIVTGSNTGLGLECARHLVQRNAKKVILGVRDVAKGEKAKIDIETTSEKSNVVEVWKLDLASYDSTKRFAKQVQGLDRLDAIIENAGVHKSTWSVAEADELTITTNVVSTYLLALLVLPKLRESGTKFGFVPYLSIVSSEVHFFTSFPERTAPSIFDKLNDEATARMTDRYNVSKLLEVFVTRELAARAQQGSKADVIINYLNPGFCHSELLRDEGLFPKLLKAALARTTEQGSRTLVNGIEAGKESHGQYLANCVVTKPANLVTGAEGPLLQERIWKELSTKLEKIQPGITSNI